MAIKPLAIAYNYPDINIYATNIYSFHMELENALVKLIYTG